MTKIETIEIEAEVVDHVRELARQRGGSLSDAIDAAVREKLTRDKAQAASLEERRAKVMETLERFWALPTTGEILTDADLYDEDGFPK